MSEVVLLGPQRLRPTLAEAVRRLGVDGPLAAVTAGWQEREDEVDELSDHLGQPVLNLRLYRRAEEVFLGDRELFAAYRRRQEELKQLQRLYRLRLDHSMAAARALLAAEGEDEGVIGPEREAAIAAVRELDAHHQGRVRLVHERFEESFTLRRRSAVARHRRQLRSILRDCAALAVAGGHVAVLLNRLRLFDLPAALDAQPVIAWSAGAMALAERVVLFHDRPPQGAGNAEILDSGLGLFRGILPLPHAQRRLALDDPVRVGLLARRLSPATCVAMDEGSSLQWTGSVWKAGPGTRELLPSGGVAEMAAA